LLGVIDETKPVGSRFDWSKLRHLSAPAELAADVYGWGTTNFDSARLLGRIGNLAASLGIPVEFRQISTTVQSVVDPGHALDQAPPFTLLLTVFRSVDPLTETALAVGFIALPLSPTGAGNDGGIAAAPIGTGNLKDITLGPDWAITADASCASDIAALFRPNSATFKPLPGGSAASVELKAKLASTWRQPLTINLGGAFELSVGGVELQLDTVLQSPPRFAIGANLRSLQFKIDLSGADGFLTSILPAGGLQGKTDLPIIWSPQSGFQIAGGSKLTGSPPAHVDLGKALSLKLQIGVELVSSPFNIGISAAMDVTASLGSITATVERIGVQAAFDIGNPNEKSANGSTRWGPFGADVRFLPPDGAGLQIDAGAVVGGGYLSFDAAKKVYTGLFELELLEKLQVEAIGLLTTAPGAPSLIGLVFVEGFAPLQLGLGFTLTGIGGVVGINRSAAVDVLRAGLRGHTLDHLLFPENPVRDAPQIIGDLEASFPLTAGRYVFGPMVRLAWGTPPLLTANLAVLLELPAPLRGLLLARLEAILPPAPLPPLIVLHADALGLIDLGLCSAALDATIHDSQLATFTLAGDLALRASWGAQPTFMLAVGGFHPRFTPPPDFPKLRRLTISLAQGDNFRLRLENYLELTSNTAQFGAQVELHAVVGAPSEALALDAVLGFDALFHFAPVFGFVADVHGHLVLSGSGITFVLDVELRLSGPSPWQACLMVTVPGSHVSFPPVVLTLGVLPPPPRSIRSLGNMCRSCCWRPWATRATGLRRRRPSTSWSPCARFRPRPKPCSPTHWACWALTSGLCRWGSRSRISAICRLTYRIPSRWTWPRSSSTGNLPKGRPKRCRTNSRRPSSGP
jgi:hypothetical protein